MKRFRRILVVQQSDEDLRALRQGIRLAAQNHAALTVMRVLKEVPRSLLELAGERRVDLHALLASEARDELEGLVRKARAGAVEVAVQVAWGNAAQEIICAVLRDEHDILLKTADTTSPTIGERIFGSTDMQLMRKCPCPAWMLKPSKSNRLTRIMAAVDPDAEDGVKVQLNHLILDLAIYQAKQFDAKLDVVTAWQFPGEFVLRGPRGGMTESEVDAMLEEVQAVQQAAVETLMKKHDTGDVVTSIQLVRGLPHEALARYVAEKKVGLVVMGTLCRTGLPGILIGNTAENMLQRVSCSVLTVKPAGFVSPVSLA